MGCSVLVKESSEAAFDVIVLYYLPTYFASNHQAETFIVKMKLMIT